MIQDPLVSVVIPAYNAARWITETLESVQAQDFSDIEVIVVDDGSTDNTGQVVSAFGERVIYIHKQNGGTGSARNTGIRAAKGRYVAFVDADDLWMEDKLRSQMELLKTTNVNWVYSDAIAFDNNSGEILYKFGNVKRQYNGDILIPLFFADFIPSPTPLILKSVFDEVGYFDEGELRNTEDYDMWLKIAARFPVGLVSQPLAKYRVHFTSKTGIEDPEVFLHQESLVIERAMERDPGRLSSLKGLRMSGCYSRVAGIYARKGEWSKAQQTYKKAIQFSPGFTNAYIGWGACFCDGWLWRAAFDFRRRFLWRR